jgi:hypothetical protein
MGWSTRFPATLVTPRMEAASSPVEAGSLRSNRYAVEGEMRARRAAASTASPLLRAWK